MKFPLHLAVTNLRRGTTEAYKVILSPPNHWGTCETHKVIYSLPTRFFPYARIKNRTIDHLLKGPKSLTTWTNPLSQW